MRPQTLGLGQRENGRRQGLEPPTGNTLHAVYVDEVRGAQPAAEPCGATGRQNMIRAGGVVPGRLGAVRADKDGARPGRAARHRLPVAHQMLRSNLIGQLHRLVERDGDDNDAVPLYRRACRAVLGQVAPHLRGDPGRKPTVRREHDGVRVRIMLGLGNQVGGHPDGVTACRDDDDLGRSGVEIDRAVGGDQGFGGGNVGAAGPDDLVDRRYGGGAVGQRRDSVRSAQTEQPRGPGDGGGGQDGRVRPRTDHEDLGYAGDPRRDHGHQQRGRQRIASGRHIAAHPAERRDPLLNLDTWCHRGAPAARHLPPGDPTNVPRRRPERRP